MATQPVPESVALPPSEFLSIGRGIKDKLEALKASKLAAKQQRAASAADQLQSFVFSLDSSGSSNDHSAAAAAASTPAAPAAAASASAAVTPAPVRSAPLGFAGGDDFISLKLGGEDDEDADAAAAAADATPARGTKRKYGDDASTPGSSPPPVQAEGAYKAPWATCAYSHPNFTVRMHEELLDFCTYVSPKSEEQIMREELVQRLQALVREAFPSSPNVHLKPFGSYATKLYLPISDIDLVLFGVDDDRRFPPGEKGKNSPLGVLERTMRSKQNATYLEHISGARIPILKLTDKATGVKIDICYNIEGGLRAAEFIVGMQKQMPALRPLTLFLKYFLHCRILNDTYKGGIGSFMLQLMLINHLQSLQLDGRLSHPNTNLGMLLMSFLESYGISLNYKHAGLNMNAALNPEASGVHRNSSLEVPAASSSGSAAARVGFFNKFNRGWYNANRPYLLSIENPLDPNHDVGSNSYLIMRVRKALQFAYNVLAAHVFHEAERVSRGEPLLRKKQRFDLTRSSETARPFARPSHTPHTLLSHIISVNDEIRADQVLVEYEEMAELVEQQEQAEAFRKKHVHKIESSSDDDEEEEEGELGRASATSSLEEGEVKPASASSAAAAATSAAAAVTAPAAAASASSFGDMDVHPELQIADSSSSSEGSYTSASESDDDVDVDDGPSAAISKFESRQVDRDGGDEEMDEDEQSGSDDSSAEGEDSDAEQDDDDDDDADDVDGDDSGALDSDLDSTDLHRLASSGDPGLYSSGSVDLDELNRYSNRKSRRAGGAHKLLGEINAPPGDFISLSGYSAPPSSRSNGHGNGGGKGGSRKKGKGYQFDNNNNGGGGGGGAVTVRKHKSSKKKQSKQQQGVRTGGTKPNNGIFESKRSKERKSTKKKKDKQARKKQRS